jgi:hypothetical protein
LQIVCSLFWVRIGHEHLRSELMALAAIRRLLIHILDFLSGVCLQPHQKKTPYFLTRNCNKLKLMVSSAMLIFVPVAQYF